MTTIKTVPLFKKNYLFELPTDVKQIIKKKENEVEEEHQKIAKKFQELTNADTDNGQDFTYIIDEFKYMSNEEFDDIDYQDELFRIIGAVSIGRENEAEFQMLFNSNQIDQEDLEYAIENVKKDDNRIKKLVNDYGVFKLLKMYQEDMGDIDINNCNEIEWYNRCYYQLLRNVFNSKITFKDIQLMRKYDLRTEYQ
jgi:hypothetical protein